MPERMFWTERLFQSIPIGNESGSLASFLAVRFIRSLCLTLIVVFISIPITFVVGPTTQAYDTQMMSASFYFLALLYLVFVVSGWFQNKWDWFFSWSSNILKLNETEFAKFRDRREKFVKSSSACLAFTLIIYVIGPIPFLALMYKEFAPIVLRPAVLVGYLAFTNFLISLLVSTLLWMIISMWITFYITLRQPLNLKLSPQTDEQFRPLAIWSLKALFIAFAFLAVFVVFVNLGVIFPGGFAGYLATLIFLATMGILAFMLPFYHVHRILVKLKKQELDEIEEEHDRIVQNLAGTASAPSSDREAINNIISLEVLHLRERRAKDADEWPIDTTMLSAVAGLVLIPIVVNIITNII